MGRININADISGDDRVGPALRDGLEDGLEESGDWLLRNGVREARGQVRAADRIWRREVYHGFETDDDGVTNDGEWSGEIRNAAPHARVVEEGLNPGTTPPVQNLIEWVSDNMAPMTRVDTSETNVSSWHPDLQQLAGQYGAGYVRTAFALQEHLEENGYRGIEFMDAAETYLNRVGPMVIKRKVERAMQRALEREGLA